MVLRVCRFHTRTVVHEGLICLLSSHLWLLILYLMGLSVSESSASRMKKEATESVFQNKASHPQNDKPPEISPPQRTSLAQPITPPPDSEAKINGSKQTWMRIHPEPQSLSSGASIINLSSKKSLREIKQMKILQENMVSVDRFEPSKPPSKFRRNKDESRISEEGGEVEAKIAQYTLNPNTREAICGGSNPEGKTRRQLMKDVAQGRRDTMEDPFLDCLTCSRPDFQIGNPLNRYKRN